MANITIFDTGYIKPTNTGTQLSSGNRANAGTAMTLKAATFLPSSSSTKDDTSIIGSSSTPEVNHGSNMAPTFTLTGLINTNVAADVALLYQLWRLPLTKGYKALYYNVDRTTTEADSEEMAKQLITMIAGSHYDVSEPQTGISISLWTGSAFTGSKDLTDVEHVHVLIETFKPSAVGENGIIKYTLTGKILPNT